MPMRCAGVLLAGGSSTRMGRDKARLPYGCATLIEHQLETLARLALDSVFISARPGGGYEDLGVPILEDDCPGAGPLAGIAKALSAGGASWVVVLAVDMPAMTADYLGRLLHCCAPGIGCVPQNGAFYEPLAAVYPQECLGLAQRLLQGRSLAMQNFVRQGVAENCMRLKQVTEAERELFANWNTPDLAGR